MINQMTLQAYGGLVLFALLSWQLATGLRWIKLPRKQFVVHKTTGIIFFFLGIPHMLNGLDLAFGVFSRFTR